MLPSFNFDPFSKQINCGFCIKNDGELLICNRPRQIISLHLSSPSYNPNSRHSILECECCYSDKSKNQKQDNVDEQPVTSPLLIMYFTIPPITKRIGDVSWKNNYHTISDSNNNDNILDPVDSILNKVNTKTARYTKLSRFDHTDSFNSQKNTGLQKDNIILDNLHTSTSSAIEDPLKNDEITLCTIARNGIFNNLDNFHDLVTFDFFERNLNNLARFGFVEYRIGLQINKKIICISHDCTNQQLT
ncbi:5932_t:CDS:2, partial [Dentiscutata erythropus]